MDRGSTLVRFAQSKAKHATALQRLAAHNAKPPALSTSFASLQTGYSNFYEASSVQPFAPVAAQGPWILTSEDKLVYDAGGYGMLGK